ncbi:MAG: molecular chaperone DnaJ [Candidatus Dormibacteria bacterium]
MTLELRYAPLPPIWPGGERTAHPKRSNFATSWSKTHAQLEKEIAHLRGGWYPRPVTIETGYEPWAIRQDGQPRAGVASKGDAAVILNVDSTYGPLRYWCDTYTERQDNLRAITLSLEALRAVARWGVLQRGEQYTGNLALPAGMGPTEAEEFIVAHAGEGDFTVVVSGGHKVVDLKRAARAAAARLHPDVGGSPGDWDQLQRAQEVLGI